MIRRTISDTSGNPAWVLIPQVEHARLAAELLADWRPAGLMSETTLLEDLDWVTRHHDDGWKAWDAHPKLDENGRPYEFREVPDRDIMPIWTWSIDIAQQQSPLAAHLVARHFLTLAGDDAGTLPFRRQQQARCEANRQQWLMSPAGRTAGEEKTNLAIETLRLFDWISLLLCCQPLSEPVGLPVPSARSTLFPPSVDAENGKGPRTDGSDQAGEPDAKQSEPDQGASCDTLIQLIPAGPARPFEFTLDPWPIRGKPVWKGSVQCTQVPAVAYPDVQQLKQSADARRLRWTLRSPK